VTGPWDFEAAVAASRNAETEQRRVESEVTKAYRHHARAEELYDVALARKMWDLKRDGIPATVCKTLAQGDPRIASLKRERNEKEGLVETAKIAAWRAQADRRDVSGLLDWSKRRDLAEYFAGPGPEPEFAEPIGARRAA
jgi:hypothetical protein